MSESLPPEQLKLYTRIDEILWKDWDPISVSSDPSARDEYRGYAHQVVKMLVENGAGKDQVAAYLCRVEVADMGLGGDKEKCTAVAELVLKAKSEAGV
jgi:hypothetical protein